MLLSPLLLLLVACPAQDPPAAPATHQDAPATTAPAAPSETPENVRDFLDEAQSHLYDPQAAGLRSLDFDVEIDMPKLGHLGAVHVSWTAGQEAQTVFTAAPELPAGMQAGMIEAQCNATAQQLLGGMLNRTIGSLLDQGVATMAGVQEGLVAVSHYHPAAAAQGVKSQVYLFDEDGRLQKSMTQIEAQGQKASIAQTYTWKPAADGTALLVADAQTVEASFDTPMGPISQTSNATYSYTQVGAIVLPTQISTSSKGPMSGEQIMAAKNLLVNGEAAPTGAAPAGTAPADAAPEDAAPRR